jgi:UDP-3-O-[3-hydroxymyristoyl] N-acetylglucosamine deacetylase
METAVQHTLGAWATFEDVGLHTGEKVRMEVAPAAPDTGVRFVVPRPDGTPAVVAAVPENIAGTAYATSLAADGVTVHTVEHLLAALAGLGIDNAEVHLSAPEVPIMDGSAADFVHGLLKVGALPQDTPREYIKVIRPIRVAEGTGKWLQLGPGEAPTLTVALDIDFAHTAIGTQRTRYVQSPEAFVRVLARARTFGFLREVEAMRRAGLVRGGSLDNAVVIDDEGVMNPDGLRYPDEPVRHKVLDLSGDLSLLGRPLWAHATAHRSGHTLHARAVRALLAHPECWEVVTEVPARAADALVAV